MTARATNFALLILVLAEFASGVGGFLAGRPSGGWVFWAHSVGGFALMLLLIWKWRIVVRSFARRGTGLWVLLPAAFALLFLASLTSGLLWATTGLPDAPLPFAGPVAGLTWHVVLSLTLLPLLAIHTLLRRTRPRQADLVGRRAALRWLGLAGISVLAWRATEATAAVLALPGAQRRFTGSREAGSHTGNRHPVTNWLTDGRQRIDPAAWRLEVRGAVTAPVSFNYEEVLALAGEGRTATLDCTGGWYTVQRWGGVSLQALLERARPSAEARSVLVRSATGYGRRFELAAAPSLLLATVVEQETLGETHGFPLRLIAAGHRGYDWVKWVTVIEVSPRPGWWQPPLPTQ